MLCDDADNIAGFLRTIPEEFLININNVEHISGSPDVLLKGLKEKGLDLRPVINSLLSFYFSRPSVVKPLTKRDVPLTISGIAEF